VALRKTARIGDINLIITCERWCLRPWGPDEIIEGVMYIKREQV
jgi:hypothetical protein